MLDALGVAEAFDLVAEELLGLIGVDAEDAGVIRV